MLVVLSAASFLFLLAGSYFASDMCLDAGKVYDYATSQCRADVDHLPFAPYTFGRRDIAALLGIACGIVCLFVAKKLPK